MHTWQLKFNAEKCETMRRTHSNDMLKPSYTLGTSILNDTESFKDLGVTVSRDLKWSKHVCIIVNIANKTLATIKPSVGTANTKIFSMHWLDQSLNMLVLFGTHILLRIYKQLRKYKDELLGLPYVKSEVRCLTKKMSDPGMDNTFLTERLLIIT